MADKTFMRITNKMIYDQIVETKEKVHEINGNIRTHRRWLTILSTAFGTGFLFIIGWLIKIKGGLQ